VTRAAKEYWAIGYAGAGYVLDVYPHEVARYLRYFRRGGLFSGSGKLLGQFATPEAAFARVWQHAEERCRIANAARRRRQIPQWLKRQMAE
jgi:hypothetical protein